MGELITYVATRPHHMDILPLVIGDTLGRTMKSSKKAIVWTMLQIIPELQQFDMERAGFNGGPFFVFLKLKKAVFQKLNLNRYSPPSPAFPKQPFIPKCLEKTLLFPAIIRWSVKRLLKKGFIPGPRLGSEAYETVMASPEGIVVGVCEQNDNFDRITWPDKRLHLFIPEMEVWVRSIEPSTESALLSGDPRFPFVLHAGRHFKHNANTLMRDPSWLKGKAVCTLLISPEDAEQSGISDKDEVRVTTEAGSAIIQAEVSGLTRKGVVVIPHGVGLIYQGEKTGVNVNELTSVKNIDPVCGTPLHKYVRCNIEAKD